jgi:hypothetical protein
LSVDSVEPVGSDGSQLAFWFSARQWRASAGKGTWLLQALKEVEDRAGAT